MVMDTHQPSPSGLQQTTWWGRNWKWFVPTGCMTLLLLVVVFVVSIVFVVFTALKSSDVYQTALARAKADSRVTAALGSPIEAGFFVSGSTHVTGPSGEAELSIPIAGPNGKGTIYAVAEKSAGKWSFSKLAVEVQGTGKRIDLIEQSSSEEE